MNNTGVLAVDSSEQIRQGESALVKIDLGKDPKVTDANIWTFTHAQDHKNINTHDPYFYIE